MHVRHFSTAAPRALAIVIALFGALILHACSSGDDSPAPAESTSGASSGSGSARVASPAASGPSNPGSTARAAACAVVGNEDAATVLGEPVEEGEAEDDSVRNVTGCNYISKGSYGSHVVYFRLGRSGKEKAAFDLAKQVYSKTEPVPGLGDEAFLVKLDAPVVQVHVRKGDAYYILAVTSPDEAARGARALELARKVAGKL